MRALIAEPAPGLVIVDLEGVADPQTAVRELTSVCPLGTSLIAIGPVDTADLTRGLLRAGATDYLVKPIAVVDVREAIAAVLDEPSERAYAGRVVAFTGTAGSGVSTLVATVAQQAFARRRTVTVLDLDPLSGRLGALLDAPPGGDLSALLAMLGAGEAQGQSPEGISPVDLDPVSAVCVPAQPGVSLVSYPFAGVLPAAPAPAAVRTLVEHLANRAHVVLLVGPPDPEARLPILRDADARVLLYEPILPSIAEAVRCLALLGTQHPATVVQCHPRSARSALSPAQIRYAFAERRPDVLIPFEPALHAASVGGGRPKSPGKAWCEALRQLVEQVIEGG